MIPHLVADKGNSRIKLALFRGDSLIRKHNFTDEEWNAFDPAGWVGNGSFHLILSSVRETQPVLPGWTHSGGQAFILNRSLKLPFEIDYHTPETLGADRLANAAGAMRYGSSAMVIDCGTCLTYTILENNTLTGGAISPGLRMRFKALHTFTGNLPLIDLIESGVRFPGKSTSESILAGVIKGAQAETDHFIRLFSSRNEDGSVILTGGDAPVLAALLKCPIFADPDHTLKGLHEILKFNLEA
jgi:type III pantothenate kinase